MAKQTETRYSEYHRNNLIFKVIDSGPINGKPVILLHGFPETAQSWQATSKILNQHNFRTFAIEQRGYSIAASPKGRFQYSINELVADVKAFIDLQGQPVYVIGHDWGSIVACELSLQYPDLVKHLTLVSVPHTGAFLKAMLSSTQIFTSYYIGFFQLPFIPELLFKRSRFLSNYLLKNSGMTPEQLNDFNQYFIKENRIGTAINWYRSMPLAPIGSTFKKVKVPTLFIWGNKDIAIGKKSAQLNKQFFAGPYEEVHLDATHWIPSQNAEQLSHYFLKAVN
ncbi:alpha/beta hydrolase [Acinetobacter sp. NIPH 1852]|uniref:alpha/beta fold hydrolase n=1 Tax=Acinetobacter sp. NIPH 1852 TaxID=2923428 RepID=UPI001F4B3B8D|nr:alpha/beta hydrolase [Acinetobacter sp. NIPH 1852]MCH7308410.1 alpha/beta hydrolase [Acinetobacter sp. NIPH 1852]